MLPPEIKILLVEDNPGDARLIIEMLRSRKEFQHSVSIAENMKSAVSEIGISVYDIIILDLNLPDSSGLDTLDIIVESTRHVIPVIVLTGIDDENIGLSSLERGAEDYLIKGEVDPNQFLRAIKYAIERKRMMLKLIDSERRLNAEKIKLSALVRSITDEVWFADLNGTFTIANPLALKRFNIDPDDKVEVGTLSDTLLVKRQDGSLRSVEESPP